ncbi:hypothetical protein EDB19DRAFT_1831594 [Suillus lakei]|nr:hypothetical protein EDB19DRAFT_1831594 [Suillus lakei]
MNDSPNSTCFCLHTYSDHCITQVPANLPPKGGCVTSNCLMFWLQNQGQITVQSICICGKGWLVHANLSIHAGVNNQPPAASNSTTCHQQSRPFQLANQSGQHNTSSDTSIVFNAIFIPYPILQHSRNGSPQYEKLGWSILELGKLSTDQNSTLLKVTRLAFWEIMANMLLLLMKKTATMMKNPMDNTPLLFIAPRFGMLRGPISWQSDDSSDDSFNDEVCLIAIVTIHHPHVSSFLSVSELAVQHQELLVPHTIRPAHSTTCLRSSNSLIGTSSLHSNILQTCSHTWHLLSTSGAQPWAATSPPPPAIINLTRDHIAFTSVMEWLDHVHTHAPTESEMVNHWRLFAPSVKSAALALIAFIEAQCSRVPLDLSNAKFEGAQVGYGAVNDGLHMNISSLFMSDCSYIVTAHGDNAP